MGEMVSRGTSTRKSSHLRLKVRKRRPLLCFLDQGLSMDEMMETRQGKTLNEVEKVHK